MQSSSRHGSNGKAGTPKSKAKQKVNKIKEVYGAQITKPKETLSAARIRATELGQRHKKEVPKPERRFNLYDLVSMPVKYFGYTNGRVVGYEWGADHRDFRTDEWLYWVRQDFGAILDRDMPVDGHEARLMTEHELSKIT